MPSGGGAWRAWVWSGLLLLAATAFSVDLTRLEGGVASVWIANGLVLGFVIAGWGPGPVALSGLALAFNLLVRLWAGDAWPAATGFVGANAVELAVLLWGWWHMARGAGPPRLGLEGARLFALGVVATGASSLAAAAVLLLTGDAAPLREAGTWWSAHLLGLVLFGGATLLVLLQWRDLLGPAGRRGAYVASLLMVVAVTSAVSVQSTYPLLFLTYPPLVLCAYRFGFAGVGIGLLLMAAIVGTASLFGSGAFSLVDNLSPTGRVLLFQLYVGAGALLAVPMAIAVHQTRTLLAELAANEALYRLLADRSQDLIVRMGRDGRRRYISPSIETMLGWRSDEMVETRWDLMHPEDRSRVQAQLSAVFRSGERATVVYRIRHRDGHYVDLEARVEPVRDASGQVEEVIYTSRDVSDRVRAEAEAQRLARTDALTGLANRRAFDERLDAALRRAHRYEMPLAVLALDLDRFKGINDTHGHAAGDAVLQAFAARIAGAVYDVDVVARTGGDEFLVLLEAQPSPDGPCVAARRVIEAMQAPIVLPDGTALVVGTSVGVAFQRVPGADLLEAADAALYDAKKAGRGTVAVREG